MYVHSCVFGMYHINLISDNFSLQTMQLIVITITVKIDYLLLVLSTD